MNYDHHVETEAYVLSGMINYPGKIKEVSTIISENHFYDEVHADLFKQIIDCDTSGNIPTPFTLDFPDEAYFNSVIALGAMGVTLAQYAKLIVEQATSRNIEQAAKNVYDKAGGGYVSQGEIDDAISTFQSMKCDVANEVNQEEDVYAMLEDIQDKIKNGGALMGVETGIAAIDNILSGLHGERFYIIAGRPGMGKSALAITMAHNMMKKGKKVGFISMEMSRHEVYRRVLSARLDMPFHKIDRGQLDKDEFYSLTDNQKFLKNMKIEDKAALTINEIKSLADAWKKRYDIDILFVDHIGLAKPLDSRAPRTYQVEEVSKGLKVLAKHLDIPVVGLSQINRGVEQRDAKRPTMSDLRDSGSLEQDADCVMLLYRQEYYVNQLKPDKEEKMPQWIMDMADAKGKADINIAKNRQGECRVVDVRFNNQTMFFYGE